jgi:hypothetical protein
MLRIVSLTDVSLYTPFPTRTYYQGIEARDEPKHPNVELAGVPGHFVANIPLDDALLGVTFVLFEVLGGNFWKFHEPGTVVAQTW